MNETCFARMGASISILCWHRTPEAARCGLPTLGATALARLQQTGDTWGHHVDIGGSGRNARDVHGGVCFCVGTGRSRSVVLFAIAPACDVAVASSELERCANLVRVCESKPEKDRKPNPKVGAVNQALNPHPKPCKKP